MMDNAYESPTTIDVQRTCLNSKWAISLGVVCFVIAAICAMLSLGGMIAAFRVVTPSATTPTPNELADKIKYALIPGCGTILLVFVGTVMIVVGRAVRSTTACDSSTPNTG